MNISLQSKNEFLTKMIIHFYRGWQWTKSDNDLIMQHPKPFPEPIVHYGVAFVRKIVRRTTLTFGEKLHQFFLSDCFSETCWNADQPPHTSCGHQAPDDGHVLVPVWPQMSVVSSEDMEQLVEDEAGVAGGQATQRWPQLQQDGLAPASVVWGHLEMFR